MVDVGYPPDHYTGSKLLKFWRGDDAATRYFDSFAQHLAAEFWDSFMLCLLNNWQLDFSTHQVTVTTLQLCKLWGWAASQHLHWALSSENFNDFLAMIQPTPDQF